MVRAWSIRRADQAPTPPAALGQRVDVQHPELEVHDRRVGGLSAAANQDHAPGTGREQPVT